MRLSHARRFDSPEGRIDPSLLSPMGTRRWYVVLVGFSPASTFLPPFAPRPLRRFLTTMKALTSRVRHHSTGGISLIHAAQASDRSASKHLMIFRGLLSHARQRRGLSLRTVSRLRPPGLRLRHWAAGSPDHPVESSSSRADRSFVFRCSPPRLTATQLRSTMVNERLTRRDFHSSARACFQAHIGVGRAG